MKKNPKLVPKFNGWYSNKKMYMPLSCDSTNLANRWLDWSQKGLELLKFCRNVCKWVKKLLKDVLKGIWSWKQPFTSELKIGLYPIVNADLSTLLHLLQLGVFEKIFEGLLWCSLCRRTGSTSAKKVPLALSTSRRWLMTLKDDIRRSKRASR